MPRRAGVSAGKPLSPPRPPAPSPAAPPAAPSCARSGRRSRVAGRCRPGRPRTRRRTARRRRFRKSPRRYCLPVSCSSMSRRPVSKIFAALRLHLLVIGLARREFHRPEDATEALAVDRADDVVQRLQRASLPLGVAGQELAARVGQRQPPGDGRELGQHRAVVAHQGRHLALAVDRCELGLGAGRPRRDSAAAARTAGRSPPAGHGCRASRRPGAW